MRANTTRQLVSRLRPAAALASRQQPRLRKPAGLETVTLTYYRDHVEHRVIGGIMRDLLAAHQVKLEIQSWSTMRHRGEVVSDIWLNSVNFTLPIEFSLFAYLYEVPLIQRCIPIDWQADACRWRAGEFNPATEPAAAGRATYRAADPPLADDSGSAQYARREDEYPRLVRF